MVRIRWQQLDALFLYIVCSDSQRSVTQGMTKPGAQRRTIFTRPDTAPYPVETDAGTTSNGALAVA